MWIVVYIAQNKDIAEKIRTLLQDAGLLVNVRSINQSDSDKYGCYEILVPESELNQAHRIIIDSI